MSENLTVSGHSLDDLVRSFEYSSYRENLFEQIFCSELLQGCWRAGLGPIEIDRPFVDFQGYDLVATCGAIVRHIQLKGSRGGQLAIHRRLAAKPSACVVNLASRVTNALGALGYSVLFAGHQLQSAGVDLVAFDKAQAARTWSARPLATTSQASWKGPLGRLSSPVNRPTP